MKYRLPNWGIYLIAVVLGAIIGWYVPLDANKMFAPLPGGYVPMIIPGELVGLPFPVVF